MSKRTRLASPDYAEKSTSEEDFGVGLYFFNYRGSQIRVTVDEERLLFKKK